MSFLWLFVFFLCAAILNPLRFETIDHTDTSQNEIITTKIGRISYRDGEIVISQNQQKQTEFFFTPFPSLQADKTQCDEDILTERTELALPIELYTSDIVQSVQEYLHKHYSTLCGATTSTFLCDLSLLPMKSIRIVQRNVRSNGNRYKYTVDDTWQPASFLRQSIKFDLYPSNITLCEQIRSALLSKCHISAFEVQYTTQNEQRIQRDLEFTTEHITKTILYQQIRAQSSSSETIMLTDDDFQELISESIEHVTMGLRNQENFAGLNNLEILEKHLEKELSSEKIRLEADSNTLWENVYWKSHSNRPDRLAKTLNSILRKQDDGDDQFIYSHQDGRNRTDMAFTPFDIYPTGLTEADSKETNTDEDENDFFVESIKQQHRNNSNADGIVTRKKKNNHRHIMAMRKEQPSNLSKEYIINREMVVNYLRQLSDNVYLDDDDNIIKPHSINAHLIRFAKLKINKKLFSSAVLVNVQPHVYKLSIRCKSNETNNDGKSSSWITERLHRLENLVLNLINHTNTTSNMSRQSLSIHSKWDPNGVTIAGGHGQGQGLNQLDEPFGVYVDNNQTIYIADQFNHRIIEWKKGATQGRIVAGGNGAGSRTDQLSYPTNVIIDHHNDVLIIADQGNKRIVRWPRQNGQHGETIISNMTCIGLAMNRNGDLYVSDYKKDEVRRWKIGETQGTLVAGGNGRGSGLNQFYGCRHIFVDENESLYASDTGNHRVMKWVKGAKEGMVVAGGNGEGNKLTQLMYPNGIFVGRLETVYVADSNKNRVVRWVKGSKEGEVVVGGNGQGDQTNQLNDPIDISFDGENNLYVSNLAGHSIQKFSMIE